MSDLELARILLRERWRKLNLHYGWVGYASAGLLLVFFGFAGAATVAAYVRLAKAPQFELLLLSLWSSLVIIAVISGRDMSWRIRLEQVLAFPYPGFSRLYTLSFLLGFVSFPLFVGLLVVEFWVWLKAPSDFARIFATLVGYLLFIPSVRLCASVGRAAIHRLRLLSGLRMIEVCFILISATGATIASAIRPGIGLPHPAHLMALLLLWDRPLPALFGLGILVALLLAVDLGIQRELTYSGIRAAFSPFGGRAPNIMMIPPARPGPVFRIGVLGWLRSKSALMLFVWGAVYSFCWIYASKSNEASGYLLYISLGVFFLSYLRGNLLGTDRGSIWLYYRFPADIDRVISGKSLSLTLLQGCMAAAAIAPALIRPEIHLTPLAWLRVLSYACSSILFGESCGLICSVRYPEPIDRSTQADGGTAVGALVVGAFQALYLALFVLGTRWAARHLSTAACGGILLSLPILFFIVRFAVLRGWLRRAMLEGREILYKKLSAY